MSSAGLNKESLFNSVYHHFAWSGATRFAKGALSTTQNAARRVLDFAQTDDPLTSRQRTQNEERKRQAYFESCLCEEANKNNIPPHRVAKIIQSKGSDLSTEFGHKEISIIETARKRAFSEKST